MTLLLIVLGCQSGRHTPRLVKVSGVVSIDGKPISGGRIQFIPSDARPSYGTIDSDGRFTLSCLADQDGCVIGKHHVAVFAIEEMTKSKRKWLAPPKYADPKTSGLEVMISQPTDSVSIQLSWAGKSPFIESID